MSDSNCNVNPCMQGSKSSNIEESHFNQRLVYCTHYCGSVGIFEAEEEGYKIKNKILIKQKGLVALEYRV